VSGGLMGTQFEDSRIVEQPVLGHWVLGRAAELLVVERGGVFVESRRLGQGSDLVVALPMKPSCCRCCWARGSSRRDVERGLAPIDELVVFVEGFEGLLGRTGCPPCFCFHR